MISIDDKKKKNHTAMRIDNEEVTHLKRKVYTMTPFTCV